MSAAATAPDATQAITDYAALENERADLEAKLEAVKAKLDVLRPSVLAYFQERGIDRVSAFNRTLYLRREVWCGRAEGVDAETACAALKAAGFDEFVREGIVTQSLSALLREREKGGEPAVPPSLNGVIVANEVFKVGSRKSG